MAFGNLITDGTQVAVGTYGYVVSFDLSAERIKEMLAVTMQLDGDQLSAPAQDPAATLAELFELCENTDAEAFAWYASGSTVYVFCLVATYPYSSNVRVAFEFYGDPEPIATTADELIPQRIPGEAKELFKATVMKAVYSLTGERVPREVTNSIAREREQIGV